jgi:Leucine-rich repeat (LRR) protein
MRQIASQWRSLNRPGRFWAVGEAQLCNAVADRRFGLLLISSAHRNSAMPEIDEQHLAQHPDSHYQPLSLTTPEWLANASKDRRTQLKRARPKPLAWHKTATGEQHRQLRLRNASHWTAQNRVDQRLEQLQDAQAFAAPLLANALKTRFGLTLDVRTTFLRLYIPATIPWFTVKSGAARTWTVSLLDAALHNFEADETQPDAFEAASEFITQPDAHGHFQPLPEIKRDLSIPAFTQLCRTLDIGAQYKTYLEENLGITNGLVATVLQHEVKASERAALEVALQLANMNGDLEEDMYQTLQGVLDGRPAVRMAGKPVRCHDLHMMSARLTGIVLFAPDLEREHGAVPVVAYVPDDPQHPIKQYTSTAAFTAELTRQLRDSNYQHFFSRFLAHEDRGFFFANLNSRLGQITWHPHDPTDPQPTWRETPRQRPNLQLSAPAIPGDLLAHLYQQKLNKILNDANVIAVATATVDQKARWALWDSFQQIATSLLNIAALVIAPFVPVLGEAMLAYMAYQLLDETFEGIVDWAVGQTTEAFEHLMGMVEALVQLGTFGAGGAIVAGEFRALLPQRTVAFIDSLKPVPTPNGTTRYWKPDLKPYERKVPLPDGSAPNQQGIHQHLDQAVISLDDTPYVLNKTPDRDGFSLAHPERPDAYQPKAWHNGTGAWQTELDQPLYWDRATLLRRLGHRAQTFSAQELEQIRSVSNTPENVLRQMHVQREPMPALLEDTLKRFKIEQDISTFIEQMSSNDPAVYRNASPLTQLQLLCDNGTWPETKALQVVDGTGQTLWQYSPRDGVARVRINQVQLNSGDLLKTVLLGLDESEIKTLLSEEFGLPARGIDVRTRALRNKIAQAAERQKSKLFESRYKGANQPVHGAAQQLMDSRPGLPASAADVVLEQASNLERAELGSGKVPKRLDQLANWARQETRLNRAYEGLYLKAPANLDTHTLALHSLPELPGWSGTVRLEVREHSVNGTLRDSIGQATATERKVLVHEEGEYQAYDDEGLHLQGKTDFYNAVLQALPDSERNALNLHIRQGPQLRQSIAGTPLPRDRLRPILERQPVRPPAAGKIPRLPGGMNGYALAPEPMPAPGAPPSLIQRAQALYPGHTPAQNRALIHRLNRLPGSALPQLQLLQLEYARLFQDLAIWRAEIPTTYPGTQTRLGAAEYAYEGEKRIQLADQIRRCWRRETESTQNNNDEHLSYSLVYEEPILGELPTLTANFDHVSTLGLAGTEGTSGALRFIQRFRNLKTLELRSMPLGVFPEGLETMPNLTELVLDSCDIQLTEQSLARLSSMSRLESLDLFNNPLGRTPSVEAMPNLKYLDLSSTEIDQLPAGLLTRPELESAIINNNRITELPDALFELPDTVTDGIDLESNPFPDPLIDRIKSHFQRTGERWEATAPWADIDRLKALYPTFTTHECNLYIFGMPGDLEAGRLELGRLGTEYEKLTADLQEWQIDVPTHHPTLNLGLLPTVRAHEQVKRQALKELLEACWRRETATDDADDGLTITHELNFNTTLIGELPTVTANFDHVTLLSLQGEGATTGLGNFLDSFPRLRSLTIRGYRLQSIPAKVFQLARLHELVLPNCTIQLNAATADALAEMHRLTYLDLSDNLLGITPRLGNMQQLEILDLQSTGIRVVPQGMFSLRRIESADLRDNAIRHIDSSILEVPIYNFNAMLWEGNPLSRASLVTLSRYARRHRMDVSLEE